MSVKFHSVSDRTERCDAAGKYTLSVALFLVLSARAVSLLARVTSFCRDFISSQVSSVFSAASILAQVETRVALDVMVSS
jgi:hypothetical protein